MRYITIDGGTSNTRIYLVKNGKVLKSRKFPFGVKEEKEQYWTAICKAVSEFSKGVDAILLSGMITKDIPHITVPAGINDLKNSLYKSEICGIPAYYIRGVKTENDMMRGEETELFAISDKGKGVYILPGSHSKIIVTDDHGEITDIKTMLTGEMLEALSKYTILKESVDFFENTIDENSLINGYNFSKEHGINHALFKTRVMSTLEGKNKSEVYSFYTGVVLSGEIDEITKLNPDKITIAGKRELLEPMIILLKYTHGSEICEFSSDIPLSVLGAVKIFEA